MLISMMLRQAVEEVAARRKVRWRVEMINQDPPATCSPEVPIPPAVVEHSDLIVKRSVITWSNIVLRFAPGAFTEQSC
jgi:hypothetical protein